MDRDAIERRDFPLGPRGYDAAAVDAHLRRVADEMDALRGRAAAPAPPASGLAASASDRVREILEAAERGAAEIREAAGREASAHAARAGEAAATMTARLEELQRELGGLLEGLRGSAAALEDGLTRLRDGMTAVPAPAPGGVGDAARGPGESDAAPALDQPADPQTFAADEAGARLVVLNMALGGTPREEAARFLAEHYGLPDAGSLLDDVYSRADQRGA